MITLAKAKKFLRYNKITGNFISRVPRKSIRGVGQIVGTIHSNGYTSIRINGDRCYAHRLAWLWCYGKWPTSGIDHINGNRNDNRICNLREATAAQNTMWRKLNINNTSGYRGVHFDRKKKNWCSQIKISGKQIYLGNFSDPKQGALVYDAAARQAFGKFAKTNKHLGLL